MSTPATFDFGSVGNTLPTLRDHETATFEEKKTNFNPRTPLRLSEKTDELFVMNTKLEDSVYDNLKNILLTNRGERVMNPNFGANLKAILAEYGTKGFESEVMARINTAVKMFMPYVTLSTMQLEKLPSPPDLGVTVVRVNIKYSVPQVALNDQELSVTLSTIA